MDTELKCNRLTCRKGLIDKAVVTTCSHIFCIDCANELFTAARLCPACETSLTEPDDIVVCSLQPTNDYKTSVLSGLAPSIILEICSRAISFWQYQTHQENSFQQAVIRNINDKNAQLQKQLENVVREANGEISLLGNKTAQLERDLEIERRKVRELQDSSRERDKEYQKLKIQHDKLRRKALLGPANPETGAVPQSLTPENYHHRMRHSGTASGTATSIDTVVGGTEAQRTPLAPRVQNHTFTRSHPTHQGSGWTKPLPKQTGSGPASNHRQPFAVAPMPTLDRSYRSVTGSEYSDSSNEVEQILLGSSSRITAGWGPAAARNRPAFAPAAARRASRGFRPAVLNS